jgi:alkylation response protein AidB-like acyl-CoA dehydrogenase
VRRYRIGALRIPRELGGGGATVSELISAVIEMAILDPNVAHTLRSHFLFVEAHLLDFARGELEIRLQGVVDGLLVGNATTELGSRNTGGTERGRFATTLRPRGDGGYILDGTKYYSTGTIYSDLVSVTASLEDGSAASALIPVNRAGVVVDDDWDGIGQRLTGSGTSHFHEVQVERDEVIFSPTDGSGRSHVTTLAQIHLTAVVAGILRAVERDAVALLRGRSRTFTHGSSAHATDDPLLQQVIGQLATNAFVAESVVMTAARSVETVYANTLDSGEVDQALFERAAVDAAQAKIAVDGLAAQSGWQLFDVAGASATLAQRNLDRHWRNARTIASHNPSIYKSRALGDRLVNGKPLPASNLF